jgi:hypothetical protein
MGRGATPAQAAPEDDIVAMLQSVKAAWNSHNVDAFLSHFTDAGLEHNFGSSDPAELRPDIISQFADEGNITSLTVENLLVTSGNAVGFVEIHFSADSFVLYEKWHFYYFVAEHQWKIGEGESVQKKNLPAGIAPVNLNLQEYSFNYDKAAVASGNFAFQVTNVGQQQHEVLVLKITNDAPLSGVLNELATSEEDEIPAGIDFVAFGGPYDPASQGTVFMPTPLSAGRYALVCFVSGPGGTPHAFLGMTSEFTVGGATGGGGAITPPNTGDAGLSQHSATGRLLLLAGLVLLCGGTMGLLVRARGAGA